MSDRIHPAAIDATGYVGDGAQYLADDGTWKIPAGGGGSGVESVVAGTGIAVDSTDPANPVVSATGGGGAGETWEDAVTALTGKVHDWKFTEAAGSAVDDAVGALDLTLNGTYTRDVSTLTGKGATLDGSTGYAASAGLGSIPVGAANRTVIVLFRTTNEDANTEMTLCSYGSTGTRGLFEILVNVSTNRPNIYGTVAGTNAIMNTTSASDATYHLAAFGVWGGLYTILYLDQQTTQANQSAAISTTNSGNFYVGQRVDGTRRAAATIDEVIVCNKWVGKAALDRLFRSLPAA